MMTFTPQMFADLARTANDPEAANKAAGLLNGEVNPETIPNTETWLRGCYHRPSRSNLVMHAINAVLDLHGVEVIERDDDILLTYCNAGDPYIETVILDHRTGEYRLGSWGDVVEKLGSDDDD